MPTYWKNKKLRPFLIINPKSGKADPQATMEAFRAMCARENWDGGFYTMKGHTDLPGLVSVAVAQGYNLIMASGGDGTVSGVVNGMAGKEAALAIIPTGTGNGLAKALGVPLTMQAALNLAPTSPHIAMMDIMEVDGRFSILNVSAGISSQAIQKTDARSKQAGGMLAYVQSFAETMQNMETYRFQLCVDGKCVEVEASEVIISNGTILNDPPIDVYGKRSDFFDGRMQIQIIKAGHLNQYLALAWDLLIKNNDMTDKLDVHFAAESVSLAVPLCSLGVQMDGDLHGRLPVHIKMRPALLPVLLPGEKPRSN